MLILLRYITSLVPMHMEEHKAFCLVCGNQINEYGNPLLMRFNNLSSTSYHISNTSYHIKGVNKI